MLYSYRIRDKCPKEKYKIEAVEWVEIPELFWLCDLLKKRDFGNERGNYFEFYQSLMVSLT